MTADLAFVDDLRVKMLNDDVGFLLDGLGLAFDKSAEFLLGLFLVKHGVFLDGFHNLIEAGVGGVVFQHIHDEALFDGLLHGVLVERLVADFPGGLLERCAEHFKGLILGCCGEGIVVGVGHHLAAFDDGRQAVFQIHFILTSVSAQRDIHLG